MSGRLGEPFGFKPGVVKLVGTIVGAFARRNSYSWNRGIAKVKIKFKGVLSKFLKFDRSDLLMNWLTRKDGQKINRPPKGRTYFSLTFLPNTFQFDILPDTFQYDLFTEHISVLPFYRTYFSSTFLLNTFQFDLFTGHIWKRSLAWLTFWVRQFFGFLFLDFKIKTKSLCFNYGNFGAQRRLLLSPLAWQHQAWTQRVKFT